MKRKKRRDQRARPSGVCCSQQKPEDKERVCYMNQCVNQQMATCIHAEELAVDHMCDPREWMPVPLVKGGKGPGHSRECHAAIYHSVLLDIPIVIQSDELMPDHLRINRKCHYRQAEQDEQIGSPKCRRTAPRHSASPLGCCSKANSFSFLRFPFGHAVCEPTRAFNCAWSKKYGWRELIRALEQHPQCPLSRHRFVQFNSLKYKRHASGSQRPSCVRRSFASSSDQSFRTSGSSSRTCSRSTLISYAGPPMP